MACSRSIDSKSLGIRQENKQRVFRGCATQHFGGNSNRRPLSALEWHLQSIASLISWKFLSDLFLLVRSNSEIFFSKISFQYVLLFRRILKSWMFLLKVKRDEFIDRRRSTSPFTNPFFAPNEWHRRFTSTNKYSSIRPKRGTGVTLVQALNFSKLLFVQSIVLHYIVLYCNCEQNFGNYLL